MKKYFSYFSEGMWVALGQAFVALGALVGVRLLTEVLDPIAYGEIALGTTIATLINQVIFGPLGNGITRYYAPASEENDLSGYIDSSIFLIKRCVFVVLSIALVSSAALFLIGFVHHLGMAVAFVLFATVSGTNGILNGIQNAARQRRTVAAFQAMDVWTRFLLSAALAWAIERSSTVAACGYVLSSLVVLIGQYYVFRKFNNFKISSGEIGKWVGAIWKFSWPFASWGLFTWARLASDRWALQIYASKEEVGFYAAVFQLGYYPMSMLTGVVTQLFAPLLYQRAGNAADASRNAEASKLSFKLTAVALMLTGCAFLVTMFFHEEIFKLLVAKKYSGVSYLLPWVILSGGIFSAAQIVGLNMMSRLQVHALILCTVVTAIAGIAMNFIGAFLFGLNGVVTAGAIFSITYFVWVFFLDKKTAGRQHIEKMKNTALALERN
jgi:O-antigen/teichoic acid export membrane protein